MDDGRERYCDDGDVNAQTLSFGSKFLRYKYLNSFVHILNKENAFPFSAESIGRSTTNPL